MDDHRLAVTGTASTEVTPDAVEWQLVVHEAGSDGRETFSRCSARLRALVGALAGVEVTTGPVAVAPEVTERGVPTGRQHARAAVNALAPLADAGELAAAAIEAGADELHGPTLRTSGIEAARDALYAEAVLAARRRAQAMADAAGRTLGRVLSVRDSAEPGGHAVFAAAVAAPPVIPRPQQIEVAVHVVFELAD